MATLPKPKYDLWQALSLAIALGKRALEETRQVAKEPGPKGEKGDKGEKGNGLDDIEITFDGERALGLRFKFGQEIVEKTIVLNHMIYRGVFQEGYAYERGDTVTWGGSLWHRNVNGKSAVKPGGDDDKVWTLAAKKGRDGKDGINGKNGSGPPPSTIPFGDK